MQEVRVCDCSRLDVADLYADELSAEGLIDRLLGAVQVPVMSRTATI
jgi:hypothetical protein